MTDHNHDGFLHGVFGLSHLFFGVLVCVLLVFSFFYLDRPLSSFFHEHPLPYIQYVRYLGEGPVYIVLFALLACYFRDLWRRRCIGLCLGVLIPYGICLVLKVILGRARPELWFSEHLFGFFGLALQDPYWSFPSGHTTTWMAIAMGFGLIYPRLRAWFISLALLMAFTRLMSMHHYLSDILGSAYLVVIEFVLMLNVWKKYENSRPSQTGD